MNLSLILTVSLTISGAVVFLSSLESNVNARVVNNTDFSMQVPDGWVYRDDFLFENGTLLTPNEFADVLISGNYSAAFDVLHGGVIAEIAPDSRFPLKNAPLETYVKFGSKYVNDSSSRQENVSIGGERAIKIFFNSSDLASGAGVTNPPISAVATNYFVMHDDHPYFLSYIANAKDYQKYFPQFEHMVKTFKFAN